jgi:glutamate-1-semialdehyde 2,1-aminomutase
MNHISPAGPIYQAGTLSGNPLAMAAGLATLQYLNPDDPYASLALLGRRLEEGLTAAAQEAGVAIKTARSGSMFTPFFVPHGGDTGTPIAHYSDALKCDTRAYAVFFKSMLEQGVMLPPSQFEAWFISAAHTMDDIEATISKAKIAFERCAAEAG